MSAQGLVFWIFVVAWLVVLGLIAAGPVPLAIREIRRIMKRVSALVDESPVPLQAAKAQADLIRVQHALESIPALERRTIAAVTVIRTTPIVPPSIAEVTTRVSNEIRAFAQALR